MKFLNLFEITVGVSKLIVLLGIIRLILKKRLNPNIRYFLWSFVAVHILVPFQLEFSVELHQQLKPVLYKAIEEPINIQLEDYIQDTLSLEELTATGLPGSDLYDKKTIQSAGMGITMKEVLLCTWLLGVIVMVFYMTLNNMKLFMRLKKGRKKIGRLPNGILLYSMHGYNCLSGIMFPVIYVDMVRLQSNNMVNNVIQHELQHYKVRDNLWQLIRVVCLIFQWHNPFVWWAYFASKHDCELACDVRTVRGMSEEERYEYCKSLLTVVECAFRDRQKLSLTASMGGGKKFMAERINTIMKYKNKRAVIISVFSICVVGIISLLSVKIYTNYDMKSINFQNNSVDPSNEAESDKAAETENENVNLNIQDYYITNTGDPSNLYYIDENKVLWGCGNNNYGQLGQGIQDYDFHNKMIKIAENVIHVDYSQTGFTIFLTEDHKLYGMGNAGCGALQQYEEFSWSKYVNGESYTVTTPYLLMENVIYARCGNSDIACLSEDSSVWIWGTIGYDGNLEGKASFEPKPVKVLENAVLITGGKYNHAALLTDGSVWTWGYNYAGNCGVDGEVIISKPAKVAKDVVMVWTGNTKLNVNCLDISEFEGIYERGMENTVIRKQDGSYWACGINVGDEEKILPEYWETTDYTVICSYEFLPYDNEPW